MSEVPGGGRPPQHGPPEWPPPPPASEPYPDDPRFPQAPSYTPPWTPAVSEQSEEATTGDPTVRMAPPPPPPAPPPQPPPQPQPPPPPLPAPVSPWPDLPPVGPPRILPTPRPQRSRLVPGILIGVLVGLLLFAPAGYVIRAVTAPSKPTVGPTATPVTTADAMPAFERSQLALNQGKVTGDLGTFAKSWLPYVSGCMTNADANGPKLGDGESTRVQCRYGPVTVYFVQFTSTATRDAALGRRKTMNSDALQLVPGAADLKQRKTASGNADGNYLEYGFKGDNGRTYAGLWWDNTDTTVGGFLVVDWHDGLGESWEPLRDLWQRYS